MGITQLRFMKNIRLTSEVAAKSSLRSFVRRMFQFFWVEGLVFFWLDDWLFETVNLAFLGLKDSKNQ